MMTGNAIQSIATLAELKLSDSFYFGSLVLSYSLGNVVYKALIHLNNQHASPHTRARLAASPIILGLFAISDFLFYTKSMDSNWLGHVPFLALGFGLLNAASMDALGGTITFAMTGHMKTVSQGLSDVFFHSDPRKRRMRSATKSSARILGFFLLGIFLGTRWVTSGSDHVVMAASGMTLPAFLVEELNLPVFTLVGIISLALIQLHDRTYPDLVWNFLLFLRDAVYFGGRRGQDTKLDLSVNWFSPQASP